MALDGISALRAAGVAAVSGGFTFQLRDTEFEPVLAF